MLLVKKIKAGALQYVLVLSVIIAIVIFAFISVLFLQKKVQLKKAFYKETILNVAFGFNYLKSNNVANNSMHSFQFSDNLLEKTTLVKKQWGVLDYAIITSKIKNETFTKVGLLGFNNPKRSALYIQENNKPLAVVGNTKIIGNCYVPKQGVKRGNISGTSYNGDKLIYGASYVSKTALPAIKNKATIKNIFNKIYLNDSIRYFELEEGLQKVNSFTKATLVYSTNGFLELRNVHLTGNIIIQSNSAIKVQPSAVLKDVLLIAPTIEIASKVKGNFQSFATKKIIVKENCNLKYPSALVLFSEKHTKKDETQINVAKNSTITGSIVYYSEDKKRNYSPQIILAENTVVTGEVYCNKSTELLGTIYGSVYTNHFITKQLGSVYINHLYNAEINSKKLPKQFCGLSINTTTVKVAKWLY